MKKLKGSTLHFAILISVIIFIILGLFLQLTYTFRIINSKSSVLLSNIYEAEEMIVSYTDNSKIPNFERISLKKYYWGSYERIVSTSGKKGSSFSRTALIGSEITNQLPVMYLADQNMPLVLAGKTTINGDVFIPGAYAKPGSVSGAYFRGDKLINGKIYKSEKQLPELEKAWLSYIDSLFQHKEYLGKNNQELKFQNSFLEETEIINSDNEIIDYALLGNVILKSPYPVTIKKSAKIDQALVVAPEVKVESGFKGSLHIITSKFECGSACYFQYPSSVTTIDKREDDQISEVIINANTRFEGNIISLSPEKVSDKSKGVQVRENTTVNGLIYCQGDVEFYGEMLGSLYARRIITYNKGSKYLNHLFECTISNKNLPTTFAGPVFMNSKKTIATWLY